MYRKIIYTTQIEDAPEIRSADLMAISEAAEFLEVSVQTVDYHIRTGQLVAVISADDTEFTSYKRRRRWVVRTEVEKLKVLLIDNALNGQDWKEVGKDHLVMWLPEVTQAEAVKGSDLQPIRRITLNQDDTGDLEIDVVALRHKNSCVILIDIQSERRYPDMSNIQVTLNLPSEQRVTTTNKAGAATFDHVPCGELHMARITIKAG